MQTLAERLRPYIQHSAQRPLVGAGVYPSLCWCIEAAHRAGDASPAEFEALRAAVGADRVASGRRYMFKAETFAGDLEPRCRQWEAWATGLVEQVQKELDKQA